MRTEEEKVCKASLTVALGGEEYRIAPLVIRDSREWKSKVAKAVASLPQYARVTADNPDEYSNAISGMLVAMPDTVVDLFFAYAKDLDREEIEGIATDAEIAAGFELMVEVTFPLAQSLIKAMGKVAR